MGYISVATLKEPEFININSISPLISKCEIKVLYIGQNRNHSFISKEVATEMAQTLPGCPIVGYYSENKEDFRDHGNQLVIDGDGFKFNSLTKPYGFIAPDTKVWFQEFEETDPFGNKIMREYLMTEGYIWTEQFEEAKKIFDNGDGRPQSMELDEKTLKGFWSTDTNSGIEFFIINDAVFSKLCILGEDVEPCFEGASITEPKVSNSFTLDSKDIQKSLLEMMNELKFQLQDNKGGAEMPENEFSNEPDKVNTPSVEENKDNTEFEKDKEKDKESSKEKKDENKEKEENNDKDKKDDKYQLLQTEFSKLQEDFSLLKESYTNLLNFKNQVEEQKKDDLIASFYMLSDEDKKDVIENKTKYSLDDIEAKLSVICVRKKVNFDVAGKEGKKEDTPAVTFNLNQTETSTLPAWLKAVEDVRKNNQ